MTGSVRSGILLSADAVGRLAIGSAGPVSALRSMRQQRWPALSGVGADDHVALTFDDGPDPRSTPAFLATLAKHEVRATFFLLGRMLATAPGLGKSLVDQGHEPALHGWSHRCLLSRGRRSTYDDLARGHDALTVACAVRPRWYRPPYGVLTAAAVSAAQRLDMTPVLWTTWGRDWTSRATTVTVFAQVQRRLGPGGTVLLHDSDCTSAPGSWTAALGALPLIIDSVRSAGLTPGPLCEHGLVARRTASDAGMTDPWR